MLLMIVCIACKDAQLLIWTSDDTEYELVVGGYSNTKTELRRGKSVSIELITHFSSITVLRHLEEA